MRATTAVLSVLFRLLRALVASRADLALENAALRQQLANLRAGRTRPRIEPIDRVFWIALRGSWARWAEVLIVVRPSTVVGWHRKAFRAHWRWISRRRQVGRPRINREVQDLIRQMARENRWGAPRIHAELQLLGFDVSERTVSNYLRGCSRRPGAAAEWRTFLANHRDGIAAMDFLVVPTASFRLLYVLFVIHHGRRRIAHFNVTAHPTSAWVAQQLREAFPFDSAPAYLIYDRDSIFSKQVTATIRSFGTESKRTAYRSPWQNGIAERWVRSCREDLLDHVIVLGEDHLRQFVASYVTYYLEDRPHLSLAKRPPNGRAIEQRPSVGAKVVILPRVGGLHHRYTWREAA